MAHDDDGGGDKPADLDAAIAGCWEWFRRDFAPAVPRDGAGRPLCACGAVIAEGAIGCDACTARRASAEALGRFGKSWARLAKQLPAWPWARFSDEAWCRAVDPRALAAARSWRLSDGPGLVLLGPSGAGKTSALVARLWAMHDAIVRRIEQGGPNPPVRFVFTSELDLVGARRAQRFGQPEAEIIVRAKAARLAVIDEVGAARDASAAALLFEVIDARHKRGFPTTITSGLRRAEMVDRYGVALMRRVIERAEVIDLFGEPEGAA